jgi:hypothetical protein
MCKVFNIKDQYALIDWLGGVTKILSLLGGVLLTVCCLRLRRRHPDQQLVYRLLQLGVTDAIRSLWLFTVDLTLINGISTENFPCGVFAFGLRWLELMSFGYELALAINLLLQLRRKAIPRSLALLGRWIPVLAFLLNIGYIIWPATGDTATAALLCVSNKQAGRINVVVVLILFVCTLAVYGDLINHSRVSSPHSVMIRSVRSASLYLVAFLLTDTGHVIYHIWIWADPDAAGTCGYETFRVISVLLVNLSGFFNFCAFWIIARRASKQRQQAIQVAFRSQDCLQEVQEIPHGEEHRKRVPKRVRKKKDKIVAPSDLQLSTSMPDLPDVEDQNDDSIGSGSLSFLGDLFLGKSNPAMDAATDEDAETALPEGCSDGFVDDVESAPRWN